MVRAGGVFGGTKPTLEINPISPFIVFYGEPSESQDAELKGKLVLNAPESMSVRSIKMTLTGTRKVSWSTTTTVTPQPITTKRVFLNEDQNIFPTDGTKNKAHKINAGKHEWDFSFPMPSTLEESVEGIGTNWIVYSLKATVDRGYISKQLSATSHIRVIRTLGRDLMETMPMEQINEDIWASKLAYKITVPQKNFIVGTSVTADFILIPLRKGVEISTIKMELIESRQLFTDYAGRRINHLHDMVVASCEGDMPANSAHTVPNGVEEPEQLFDESHHFKMTLDFPRSLKNCRQSVDTEWIRISHKLKLYVNLRNPEGHTSQLLVKNHVHLFISPNLPPNEDQTVVVDHDVIASAAMRDEMNQNAPPTYGLHQLDELYSDIDPSGFMTPGAGRGSMGNSGANTPFYAHSRSGSAEDLNSLDALAQPNGGGASATALHSRLHHLSMNERTPPLVQPTTVYSGTAHVPAASGGSTPRSGTDETPHLAPPSHSYFAGADGAPDSLYDMEALARTPSYNTAVRTPARTPLSEDLPTYEIATSRPSSPNHGTRNSSGRTTPSPTRSLDTLTEETERNTHMNSRRGSPTMSPRNSDEGRSLRSTSTSSSTSSASISSSVHSTNSAPLPTIHTTPPSPLPPPSPSQTTSTANDLRIGPAAGVNGNAPGFKRPPLLSHHHSHQREERARDSLHPVSALRRAFWGSRRKSIS